MSSQLFYFVRHGESLMNAAHFRQGPDGSLSDKGKAQAAATGERLSGTVFDATLVSPYTRTMETAEILLQKIRTRKPPELNDLIIERRNPSEIVGKSAEDQLVKHIVDLIDKSDHADNFRYSDEENFEDLKQRAAKLLQYLAGRKEKKILVVTHSIFLKMIVAYIVHGESLNAYKYNVLSFLNDSNNASITVCRHNRYFIKSGLLRRLLGLTTKDWEVVAWDDYTRPAKPSNPHLSDSAVIT